MWKRVAGISAIERLDEDHSNRQRRWQSMGELEYLSAVQVERLTTASVLKKEKRRFVHDQGNIALALSLPPQSVAAVSMEFDRA
ncbi:MAG TPA: hypothetical protein VFE02_19195 [Candidatus Acidoferrales bacterium]|nr:hypothetical protein [Candidatus Acidoferrales bacterium]